MKKHKMIDYRELRPWNITSLKYRHLLLLIYWPIYGFMFLFVERIGVRSEYHVIHCFIDDYIPFCEYFIIPYLFWFVFLVSSHILTLLFDADAFRRMMYFTAITYTAAIIIYIIFPNCQELRPAGFARDNVFTEFMKWFYTLDTNTNVCPSIHVIGSIGAAIALWDCREISPKWIKISSVAAAVLISVSTMFLKQHSAVDVIAALPVSAAGYLIVYVLPSAVHKKRSKNINI